MIKILSKKSKKAICKDYYIIIKYKALNFYAFCG